MWVQLKEVLNTGRYDGRPWPPPYTDWEVPDWEGDRMILSGLAWKVPGPPPAPPAPPAQEPPPAPPPVATIPEMVSAPSATGQPEPPPPSPPPPEPELPEPAPNDAKQAWVDYAVSQGASSGEAATMTKAQLMQAYGGRL